MEWKSHAMAISLLLGVAATVGATPVVDQSQAQTQSSLASQQNGGAPGHFGQSFTVGLAGELSGVDLRIFGPGGVTPGPAEGSFVLEIRPIVGGAPTLENVSPLVSLVEPISQLAPAGSASSDAFTHFDLSAAGIVVAPGEVLAITVHNRNASGTDGLAGTGNGVSLFGAANNPYAAGGEYGGFYGSSWGSASTTSDLAFQTYVDANPNSSPEPCALTILVIGAGAALTRRRLA